MDTGLAPARGGARRPPFLRPPPHAAVPTPTPSAQAGAGRQPAAAVILRYYRELLNFVAKSGKDRDGAADVVQEAYARVLAVQRSGQAVPEPRALLYRTVRNVLIDLHRRSQVRGEPVELDADPEAAQALPAGPACEPEAAAASAQGVQAMLATIAALPLRCREAFILYKFDGLPQQEVAHRMGISPKMVEQHVKRAMQACRACRDAQEAHGRNRGAGAADPEARP